MDKAVFDDQGKYFWSLVKQAEWDRKRVEAYMIKKFNKTHWSVLNEKERRQSIATMRGYADQNRPKLESSLRQRIMANGSKIGLNRDRVHELMIEWGYGNSLRKCKLTQLRTIYANIRKMASKNEQNDTSGGE